MIVGLGIDSVKISRFNGWHLYSIKQLLRVFSEQEVMYCLNYPTKMAERFALRFCAKEAFFKALCTVYPSLTFSFLKVCKNVEINNEGAPVLKVCWDALMPNPESWLQVLATFTHTQEYATTVVLLQK